MPLVILNLKFELSSEYCSMMSSYIFVHVHCSIFPKYLKTMNTICGNVIFTSKLLVNLKLNIESVSMSIQTATAIIQYSGSFHLLFSHPTLLSTHSELKSCFSQLLFRWLNSFVLYYMSERLLSKVKVKLWSLLATKTWVDNLLLNGRELSQAWKNRGCYKEAAAVVQAKEKLVLYQSILKVDVPFESDRIAPTNLTYHLLWLAATVSGLLSICNVQTVWSPSS